MANDAVKHLLLGERHTLFEWVKAQGMSTDDFRMEDMPDLAPPEAYRSSSPLPTLIHKPTGRKCQFERTSVKDPAPRMRYEVMSPLEQPQFHRGSLLSELTFRGWLNALKREVSYWSQPDPWQSLRERDASFAAISSFPIPNESFTLHERALIAESLAHVVPDLRQKAAAKQQTTKGETPSEIGEKLDKIQADLDYLKDASTRVGKKDFALLALGLFGAWAVPQVLPPDLLATLWGHLQNLLAALYPQIVPATKLLLK